MISFRPTLPFILCLVLIGGCTETRTLMPTPNLYANGQTELFGELVPELTKTQIELIYVTDRAPEVGEAGELRYGFKLSGECRPMSVSASDGGKYSRAEGKGARNERS